ncbi:putative polycomb group RING finger protein 6 [Monocercomonoides exilis]|uniref:putative polycomb group RING finger protein 6 n=1 Tax=Monocercomonoides exilis TaxID=2049356 RepID=UPI00355A5DAC|nr:putative polycomb group RING finger protein 6 [Monocercomonoides exilis]
MLDDDVQETDSTQQELTQQIEGTNDDIPIQRIVSHFSCPLCKELFTDAHTLPDCLHSFCQECILDHFSTSKNCPVCGTFVGAQPNLMIRKDTQLQGMTDLLKKKINEISTT